MPRPFIRLNYKKLEEAVEAHSRSRKQLELLIAEIKTRKKTKELLAPTLKKAEQYLAKAKNKNQKNNSHDNSKSELPNDTKLEDSINFEYNDHQNEEKFENIELTNSPKELGFIREPSNSLKGLPNVYSYEPKEYPINGLNEASTRTEKYIRTLEGLILEIRRGHKFSKTIALTNGKKEPENSGEYGYLYSFKFDSDEEFFEGARIDFAAGQKKTKGSVVSLIKGEIKKLFIALDEDFGNVISNCSITQDEAAFYETLKDRLLIEIGKAPPKSAPPVKMNLKIADSVFDGISEKLPVEDKVKIISDGLNIDQSDFANKANLHSISYLWGPPGTGKTQTLGAIVSSFYSADQRTLICSNTNQAVDQVLLKLCSQLRNEKRNNDLKDGKIVRIGKIAQQELNDEFSEYVTIDGISERKGSDITKKIKQINDEILAYELKITQINKSIEDHNSLEKTSQKKANILKDSSNCKQSLKKNEENKIRNNKKFKDLEKEKRDYSKKGFFGKVFSRNEKDIDNEISKLEIQSKDIEKTLKNIEERIILNDKTLETIEKEITLLNKKISGENFNQLVSEKESLESKISLNKGEKNSLEKELQEIRKFIINDAKVVGATLTKSFLSPNDLGKYSNIIIDEASMGLLPSIYFTASQSDKRVIISGDFRQIPPIIQSKNKTILDHLNFDIFTESGIVEKFNNDEDCSFSGILKEQYRMEPKICDLVSRKGYNGKLKTARDRNPKTFSNPPLFDDKVIIVDTTLLLPFSDKDPFNSTSNIAHALIARNIIRAFDQDTNFGSIGYCAPFKAQVKLVKKMIKGEKTNRDITVGTIHTFQGDEKNTIIFDTVQSYGSSNLIPPLQSDKVEEANIITVAVTRSETRLIIIGNLDFLDARIPATGYLRDILFNAQKNGSILDARKVINLVSLEKELEEHNVNINEIKVNRKDLKDSLVNEDIFYPLCLNDIENAKKYISIYSGFYTSNRVSKILPFLDKAINRGVKIRVIIPPPDRNGTIDVKEGNFLIKKFLSSGIIVDLRYKIHQKVVLIDDDIAWHGSLNPLSFSGASEETMMRVQSNDITGTFVANLAINRNMVKEEPSLMVERENPNCESCQGLTSYNRGLFGRPSYFKCVNCGENQTAKL